jgi:tubulin monoglycylase TTLL3/8
LDEDLVEYAQEIKDYPINSTKTMCARLLKDEMCNFFWIIRSTGFHIKTLSKDQIVNHFPGASFTTKSGIADVLSKHLLWSCDKESTNFFPRCYKLSCPDDRKFFLKDYKITTAMATLKILTSFTETPNAPLNTPRSKRSQRPTQLLEINDFINQASEILKSELEFKANDTHSNYCDTADPPRSPNINETCFDPEMFQSKDRQKKYISDDDKNFYNTFYRLVENSYKYDFVSIAHRLPDMCKLLDEFSYEFPEYQPELLDHSNLWIVKPGAKSRGRGITVVQKINEILRSYVSQGEPNLQKENRWIIQKYIEKPLLVENTKFDIRQWFLVDSWSPLRIWVYKDSYLRFSTREFSLSELNQAVHLCNHSIQKNYAKQKNSELPDDNMWTNRQFDNWYNSKFGTSIWDSIVYPKMTEILKDVMLSMQESGSMEHAGKMKGSFELYGADFMLAHDSTSSEDRPSIQTYLIEINSSPTMALSTSKATHKLCRNVLEDTINLVFSEKRYASREGDTIGKFELAYEHFCNQTVPRYTGDTLLVEAQQIKKPKRPRVVKPQEDRPSLRLYNVQPKESDQSQLPTLTKVVDIECSEERINDDQVPTKLVAEEPTALIEKPTDKETTHHERLLNFPKEALRCKKPKTQLRQFSAYKPEVSSGDRIVKKELPKIIKKNPSEDKIVRKLLPISVCSSISTLPYTDRNDNYRAKYTGRHTLPYRSTQQARDEGFRPSRNIQKYRNHISPMSSLYKFLQERSHTTTLSKIGPSMRLNGQRQYPFKSKHKAKTTPEAQLFQSRVNIVDMSDWVRHPRQLTKKIPSKSIAGLSPTENFLWRPTQ